MSDPAHSAAQDAQDLVSSLLRELRREAGMRQVDVADALGQPQSFVSKYEGGERRLDVLELRAICSAIGTNLGEFVILLEQRLHGT